MFRERKRAGALVVVALLAIVLGVLLSAARVLAGDPGGPLGPCPPAPQLTAAPVLSPTGTQSQTQPLATTHGTWYDCYTPFTYYYQWYWSTAAPPNGTRHAITGAVAATFTPNGYAGDYLTADVVACDNYDACTGTTSQNGSGSTGYAYVAPPPTLTTAPTISPNGTGQTAGTAYSQATAATWSSSLSITGYHYQWARNGTRFGTATSSPTSYTSDCTNDPGTTLTLQVQADNADGWSTWAVSANNAQYIPCNTTPPTISPSGTGQPADGSQQFTAAHGSWAGSATAYNFQWLSNGSPASGAGATTATYTPNCTNDAGKTLTVEVKATNTYGTSSYIQSSDNAQFTPCNTTAPTVSPSGTGQDANGTVYTAATGSWASAISISGYSYQWLRNGVSITGATSSTYTAACATDGGTTLTVKTAATNADGTSGWTTSSNDAQFVPCNTAPPTITGTVQSGQTLTTSNGAWASASPTTYTYQWQVSANGSSGWTSAPGAGATTASYTVEAADYNNYLRVAVTASNPAGPGTPANSTATSQVLPAAPAGGHATIIGLPTIGNTLTATACSAQGWSPANPPATCAFQWQVSAGGTGGWTNASGSGAASASYTIAAADSQKYLRVMVTATNTGGFNTLLSPTAGGPGGVGSTGSAGPTGSLDAMGPSGANGPSGASGATDSQGPPSVGPTGAQSANSSSLKCKNTGNHFYIGSLYDEPNDGARAYISRYYPRFCDSSSAWSMVDNNNNLSAEIAQVGWVRFKSWGQKVYYFFQYGNSYGCPTDTNHNYGLACNQVALGVVPQPKSMIQDEFSVFQMKNGKYTFNIRGKSLKTVTLNWTPNEVQWFAETHSDTDQTAGDSRHKVTFSGVEHRYGTKWYNENFTGYVMNITSPAPHGRGHWGPGDRFWVYDKRYHSEAK
jgi:hypothetical protein